jgi:hypothetical protein
MTALRRLSLLVALALSLLSLSVASASAAAARPDSDAPSGASADWLPHEPWVDQRWLPFDEEALNSALGMSTQELFLKLSATRQTVNQLAAARGVSTRTLAAKLVATRHSRRGAAWRKTMLARTRRVLTQSHLAAHMLGHVFHERSVIGEPSKMFGVPAKTFRTMYFDQHRSFAEIASAGGVSLPALRRRALAASRAAGRAGVAAGAMSAHENRLLRARDVAGFRSWATYRIAVPTASLGHSFVCHLPPN